MSLFLFHPRNRVLYEMLCKGNVFCLKRQTDSLILLPVLLESVISKNFCVRFLHTKNFLPFSVPSVFSALSVPPNDDTKVCLFLIWAG